MLKLATIKKLNKVKAFILREPRRFNMMVGVVSSDRHRHTMLDLPPCGTACCLAGAAFLIGNKFPQSKIADMNFRWDTVKAYSERYLGLSAPQMSRLFYLGCWPAHYISAYNSAESQQERAYIGAARLEYFISSNGDK